MYHCHISPHEDGGMMGQFVVTNGATAVNDVSAPAFDYSVYPNPATGRLFISLNDPQNSIYYLRVCDAMGRTIYMMPRPQVQNGLDLSRMAPGIYTLQLTDDRTKKTVARQFVVQ
jgi:bilirubin oxidase